MKKVHLYKFPDGTPRCVEFLCPGCGESHSLTVRPHKNGAGASWIFTGDESNPTLEPSILSRVGPFADDVKKEYIRANGCKSYLNAERMLICHSFVRGGRIEFLNDCTHDLKGQTVELPEYNLTTSE